MTTNLIAKKNPNRVLIPINATRSFKRFLQDLARTKGVTVSALIRGAIADKYGPWEEERNEFFRQNRPSNRRKGAR